MSLLTSQRILVGLLLTLLLLMIFLALATIRIGQDERGVWTGQAPGVEVIYLSDQAGPALWVYWWGSLMWHIERVREALPDTVPEPPPATPTPVRLGPVKLEQVMLIDSKNELYEEKGTDEGPTHPGRRAVSARGGSLA